MRRSSCQLMPVWVLLLGCWLCSGWGKFAVFVQLYKRVGLLRGGAHCSATLVKGPIGAPAGSRSRMAERAGPKLVCALHGWRPLSSCRCGDAASCWAEAMARNSVGRNRLQH